MYFIFYNGNNKFKFEFEVFKNNYRKLREACQTKAKIKKNTGTTGKTSVNGAKGAYTSGNLNNKIFKF